MRNIRTIKITAFFAVMSLITLAQTKELPLAVGKFSPTDTSLEQYQYPEWFRDAKFGIWAHWGPQSVPRQGDWYARHMYRGGTVDPKDPKGDLNGQSAYYRYHVKNYGHPSTFGYKDIIPFWTAEKWNPDELMKLYKRVGAKYFVSMGTHHDNFFLWNSKIHRWNAVNMGPKKDVVGIWQAAAKKEGLRFGVSEHLAASYTWYQTAKGADAIGDKAGVPYDGNDPKYADLYHGKASPDDKSWMTKNPVWQREWYDRITELIDMYHPDLLYSDSKIPFENNVGRSLIAHFYNTDMTKNKGQIEAVYNCKEPSRGRFVEDLERGVMDSISQQPWQTCTSIGDWFYRTGQKYKTSTEVVQMLVDIVSKNGNLLINVVQTPEGDLEQDVKDILEGIALWTKDNGDAIYGSRPWKIYGEGPSLNSKKAKGMTGGVSEELKFKSTDIRYTTKNGDIYAFCMENPTSGIQLTSLGLESKYCDKKIVSVSMLGSKDKIKWVQDKDGLHIDKPLNYPSYNVITFRIQFKK